MKIQAKSNNGVLCENGWLTMDSFKVLKNPVLRPLFDSLQVGDDIADVEFNKAKNGKDYVTSFKVVGERSSEVNTRVNGDKGACIPPSPTSLDSKILFGQCLNIAFENLSCNHVTLDFKDNSDNYPNIDKGIELASILYNKLKVKQ